MIVSVHTKFITYMLPCPLNKSTLSELESVGTEAVFLVNSPCVYQSVSFSATVDLLSSTRS